MLRRAPCLSRLAARRRLMSRKAPAPGDLLLVPDTPTSSRVPDIGAVPEFDHNLVTHLERLSLVRFSSEEAVANLREAVRVANRLKHVDVEGVAPMHTVWEHSECPVHTFEQTEQSSRAETLGNAAKTFEDYFVTPPGNVPLEASTPLDLSLVNEWDKLGRREIVAPKAVKAT